MIKRGGYMQQEELLKKIKEIKKQILKIGEMRPGRISKQFNVCGTPKCKCKDKKNPQKHGPYHYLSFNYGKKDSTQFIRHEFVPMVKAQTDEYRKFKKLIDAWIKLSIKLTDNKLKLFRKQK